jgi:hypothetical protein
VVLPAAGRAGEPQSKAAPEGEIIPPQLMPDVFVVWLDPASGVDRPLGMGDLVLGKSEVAFIFRCGLSEDMIDAPTQGHKPNGWGFGVAIGLTVSAISAFSSALDRAHETADARQVRSALAAAAEQRADERDVPLPELMEFHPGSFLIPLAGIYRITKERVGTACIRHTSGGYRLVAVRKLNHFREWLRRLAAAVGLEDPNPKRRPVERKRFAFACPACGRPVPAAAEDTGAQVRCRYCGAQVDVPSPDSPPPTD